MQTEILRAYIQKYIHTDEKGVTAIEYGLIAGLIAVAIIAVLALVGTGLNTTFSNVQSHLP
jgi:pilus assembly protein Flp/PilA